MSLIGVIAAFATGSYTVTRAAASTYDDHGRIVPGAVSTFPVTARVQAADARDLEDLPEGQRGNEVKVIYTATELRTRTPSTEPDRIAIDGESWIVIRAKRLDGHGQTYYRAHAARTETP